MERKEMRYFIAEVDGVPTIRPVDVSTGVEALVSAGWTTEPLYVSPIDVAEKLGLMLANQYGDELRDTQKDNEINTVSVRWFDRYLEEFEASEVRFGSDLLFIRLTNGQNRQIPLRQVRWFGMSKESHQKNK